MTTRSNLLRSTAALCVAVGVALSVQAADFVVSPRGGDGNPGTEAKPFATLGKARDAVRAFKKGGMKRDVIVHIRAGEYVLNEPVVFGPEDSGSDGFRVIYKNADALGSARFVGAGRATGWTRHEGKVWKKTGVKHLVTTLYEDDRRAHFARIPNRGSYPEYPNAMAPYFVSVGGNYDTLVYGEGDLDPTGWKLSDRAAVVWWTKGGKQDWGQHVTKLLSIDAGKRTFHVKGREHRLFNISSGDRFFVMNIRALLDVPGEFYQDTERNTLYYMPRGDNPNEADVRVPRPSTLMAIKGKSAKGPVHDIVFSGLSFEQTNCGYLENKRLCGAADLLYSHGVRIEKCRFRNIGDFAVFGQAGVHHCDIINCRIEHTGQGGILLQNRSVKRDEKPNVRGEFNRIHNCRIHDLGEIMLMSCHNGGVMLWNANDCRVSHCDIARNIRYGISLRGHYSSQRARDYGQDPDIGTHLSRNNVFQYIRIADVGTDSGDMGAIHAAHLNEPDGSCINTWRQIIVRGARAHPSMKDWPPDGIFVDHPYSCQKQVFMDIDISGQQGKPFRDNRNPVQTFRNVSWKTGFDRARMETNRIGLTPEFPKEYGGQGAVDRTPPSAPRWAGAGRALGGSAVRVEVAPCKDDMTGVEYCFECMTEGGHDSGWQIMPVYTDQSLTPNTDYRYRVKARDTSCARNETQWSELLTVKTEKKSNAPSGTESVKPCVARYRFEENGRDAMGDHHGKVSGDAEFSNDAREGRRSLACGKGHVTVPDHKDLDIGRGDFAISLWFLRHKDPRGNLRLLSKHDKNWQGYCIRGGDRSIGFDIGNGEIRPLLTAHTPGTGTWLHLVVNVARDAGLVSLYLNGARVATGDISALRDDDIENDAPLTIGSGSKLPWKGLVDDVCIYKRTLTKREIKAMSPQTKNTSRKETADREGPVRQWRDAKFGMFIHWGLYSIPAGVWKGERTRRDYAEHIQLSEKIPAAEYAKLAGRFNPVKFNADEWVRIAKQTGMRHIVITAKHQDGFAMYDSDVSEFDIADATPFGRDPMKELADAAHRHGLGFGFYYSQARDHHHPLANWNKHGNTWDFPKRSKEDFVKYLDEKAKPQIQELLTGYGDLSVMWFDVPYDIPPEECLEIVKMVRARQPNCVVNSRVGGEVWDYRSLGDNAVSDEPLDEPWETCMTMNDSWGYHRLDDNWKSSEDLIRKLVDIVSKGGCLLLNVGPTGEGVIPEPTVTRLMKLGEWLDTNGESIYGTRPSPHPAPGWGRRTVKGNRNYLHVFEWPDDGKIAVPGAGLNVSKAYLLADKARTPLKTELNGKNMVISLPAKAPDPVCSVVVIEEE